MLIPSSFGSGEASFATAFAIGILSNATILAILIAAKAAYDRVRGLR